MIRSNRAVWIVCALATLVLAGCPWANGQSNSRPPRAQKWYERALAEFRAASVDAAHDSVQHALDIVPEDEEVRMLAARVALARLEYDEVLRLLRGLESSPAMSLRGRALWYKGDLERAADELERLLSDPDVADPWAKSITKLARHGMGRKPFQVTTTEGNLEVVQMARVEADTPLYIVPLEIDGDGALAIVSTGNAEVMLDSASRREPSWVSLRFGQRLEVKDVPALTQDLSAVSTQLGAPIKALLGANLLRHLNATLDFRGRQFVARAFVPPPPPVASRVEPYYLRGGGMVVHGALGEGDGRRASFFVDTSMGHTVALDEGGWRKIGIDAKALPALGSLRSGSIPLLQFGAFKLPKITAVFGAPIAAVERELEIDIDGALGAGLLAGFRVTFSDGGRVLWVEQSSGVPPHAEFSPLEPPGSRTDTSLPGAGTGGLPGLGGSLLGPFDPQAPPLMEEPPPTPPLDGPPLREKARPRGDGGDDF